MPTWSIDLGEQTHWYLFDRNCSLYYGKLEAIRLCLSSLYYNPLWDTYLASESAPEHQCHRTGQKQVSCFTKATRGCLTQWELTRRHYQIWNGHHGPLCTGLSAGRQLEPERMSSCPLCVLMSPLRAAPQRRHQLFHWENKREYLRSACEVVLTFPASLMDRRCSEDCFLISNNFLNIIPNQAVLWPSW